MAIVYRVMHRSSSPIVTRHHGAMPLTTTAKAAARCVSSSSTTRSIGWRNFIWTGLGSMLCTPSPMTARCIFLTIYDGEGSGPVREFFVDNALYWLEEFHLDGLRLDAVHTIADDGPLHILDDLRRRRQRPGA